MAYARLSTKNGNGLNPNFRGLGAYGLLSTRNKNGISPNFRGLPEGPAGMGDTPLTNISFGPGGQFAISTATTPTQTSIFDQMLTWMGQSSLLPGMPNSIFVILGGALLVAKVFGGRR
jgi:hypothetical protein